MCGIVGILRTRAGAARVGPVEITAARMTRALNHRGPDSSGVWADENRGVGLGHARLAIVDLTESGHQPMHSSSGRYVITLNGEIYNFRGLRRELESLGCKFLGTSDTEVLLAAIESWGLSNSLQRIHGMYAFALWDKADETLTLVRDRLGEKPLYVTRTSDGFAFASELKAFHTILDWKPELRSDALNAYFRLNYVPATTCIFQDTWKVLPGHKLVISTNDGDVLPLQESYWAVSTCGPEADIGGASEEQLVSELGLRLKTSIGRQLIADVPVGIFLSGGIDSSLVSALAQEASPVTIKTYTVGFDSEKFDESRYAREVAELLGTNHTEIVLDENDALQIVDRLPDMYDEPFGDASQLPTFLVCREARRHVTAVLGGDGGDELFSGYERFAVAAQRESATAPLGRSLRRARLALGAAALSGLPVTARHWLREQFGLDQGVLHRKLRSVVEQRADRAPRQRYERYLQFWLESMNPAGERFAPQPLESAPDSVWESDPHRAMMIHDALNYLPDDILTKVDRAAMSVSLETRVPLLDHSVVELAQSIPSSIHRYDGKGKWMLRQLLGRYLPRHLIERKKQGFAVPLDDWLRGPLREWADRLIDRDRMLAAGILRPEVVEREWNWQKSGQVSRGLALWGVLMYLSWFDRWSPAVPAKSSVEVL